MSLRPPTQRVSHGPKRLTRCFSTSPFYGAGRANRGDEEEPGGFVCLNDDDDDNNGVADRDDPGPTPGEDDLKMLAVTADGMLEGTLTLDAVSGGSRIRVYENPDRSGVVTLPQSWPLLGVPKTFDTVLYVEGADPSVTARDVELVLFVDGPTGYCEDSVKLTVCDAKMDPVTSGIDPIPINPAIVAPMTPLPLDNGELFWEANSFALTTLEPDIDLTLLPVTWTFAVTSGFMTPTAQVVPSADSRSARLEIPFPSFGNLGEGRMEFRVYEHPCASLDALIRNMQPDLEPDDFRIQVKGHLCTDGAGAGTARTPTEIRRIMSDVTKILAQCGIIVRIGETVTTEVPTDFLDLLDGLERNRLFSYEEDEVDIDIYFVPQINSGAVAGTTLAPFPSLEFEAGIAIADSTDAIPISGQEAVRLVAHELAHYLLNHWNGDDDHHPSEPANLLYNWTSATKRDLDESQCLEMRSNYGVD